MNMAKIIWTSDLTMEPNTTSDETIVSAYESAYEGGFLVCPKKSPLSLTSGSTRHTALIDTI